MLTITPAASTPEIVKKRFTTEPAPNKHGYTTALYVIDSQTRHKYLLEVCDGHRPFYVITAGDHTQKNIISFQQNSPRAVDIISAEVYKNNSAYPARREESPRLLKKYQYIACLLYGLIKNGDAPAGAEEPAETVTAGKPYPVIFYRINAAARFMILTQNNGAWIDSPAADLDAIKDEIRKTDPAAAFTDENGARYVFRLYDAWTVNAAILREYTITAPTDADAETIARALAAGQPYSVNKAYQTETPANDPEPGKAANEPRPKRRAAYIVECRSPRGSWTAYSAEQETHAAAERIKEEAETRNTRTTDGAPIFYRIVQIDKGPETPAAVKAADAETAPQTVETDAGGQATTTPETEPQRATERAETTEATPTDTGTEKEPPRAAQRPEKTTDGATAAHAQNEPPRAAEAGEARPQTDAQTTPPRRETAARHTNTHGRGKSPPRAAGTPQTARTRKSLKIVTFGDFSRKADQKIEKISWG